MPQRIPQRPVWFPVTSAVLLVLASSLAPLRLSLAESQERDTNAPHYRLPEMPSMPRIPRPQRDAPGGAIPEQASPPAGMPHERAHLPEFPEPPKPPAVGGSDSDGADEAVAPGKRLLRFPKDQSFGFLYTQAWGEDGDTWEFLGRAQGDIAIPAATRLRWDVTVEGSEALRTVQWFPRDMFYELRLVRRRVQDESVELIAHLTRLRRLVLRDTAVTDRVAPYLTPMRDLAFLDLRQTFVTSRGIERLRAALPNCRILHD